MIQLPDDLLIGQIETQNAYYDKKSREDSTGIVKPKYKLAGNIFDRLNVYSFFVLTSKRATCQKILTLVINEKDWEYRNAGHLYGTSYLDLKRVEIFSKEEVLSKVNDQENKFRIAGKLCDAKYSRLEKLRKKMRYSKQNIPDKTKKIIGLAIGETDAVDRLAIELGLT